MPATTIHQVLDQLDAIINWAASQPSRLGYFPALYRTVTARVLQGIESGRFQDPARMERLDVVFANRYLDALATFRADQPTTGAWRAAFEAGPRWEPLILQHLLAGMNAHINLDLAIAAAGVAPGPAIYALEHDFNEINNVLAELVQSVEDDLATLSPWISLLDTVGGHANDAVVNFSIRRARAHAWTSAVQLAQLDPAAARIAQIDNFVETLGRLILRPGPMLRAGLMVIRLREESDPRRVIDLLTAS